MDAVEGFKHGVEAAEVGAAGDHPDDVSGFGLVAEVEVKIASETARVVAKASVGALRLESDWAEVDGGIGKWAGFNAAATGTGRECCVDPKGRDVEGIMGI